MDNRCLLLTVLITLASILFTFIIKITNVRLFLETYNVTLLNNTENSFLTVTT